MKKYLRIILVIIFYTALVISCKKDSAKNYTAAVAEKTWWGVFTYTGKDAEYYSVHFNANNTLVWSQFSGDNTGKWVVNGNELTMTFDISKAEIKATISDDNKLLNITDKTGNSVINTCEPIANPNIPLDNTEWKGKMVTGLPYIIEMSFRPPLKLDLQSGSSSGYSYTNNTYIRSPSGPVIRAEIKPVSNGPNTRFFGVIISATEMMGSDKNASNQWKATKQ
jgi:hypothetical protein